MIPASYRHAIDSGVYLRGVDSSELGTRLPVARDEIGDTAVFLIIGQSNGGNHGERRYSANTQDNASFAGPSSRLSRRKWDSSRP